MGCSGRYISFPEDSGTSGLTSKEPIRQDGAFLPSEAPASERGEDWRVGLSPRAPDGEGCWELAASQLQCRRRPPFSFYS